MIIAILQLLIDTVYDNKIGSFFLKDDTSDPFFKSIRLKTKCYSIFQLHTLDYYLSVIRQYIACYYVVAMCYIWRTGSYRPVYNFPVCRRSNQGNSIAHA